ncbi:LysE family translocator [Shouchella shacheensis]|uniref:LysE family translocator n=1 Tax=Shouchella shacheensis TaxID=1649580 RepID=UPI0007401ECA|nr:LysE family translocator [Shouchella shacheensis]
MLKLSLIIGFLVLSSTILVLLLNASNLSDITWGTFITASIIMAITPGPNQILSLRNGYNRGIKLAMSAVSGRFSAFLIMVTAVALGLGTLLTASSVFFQIVKWIGVVYLIYLGIQMLRKSDATKGEEEIQSVKKAIKQEFIVAMSNPKAYILFAVFLPQFISVQASNIPILILITGISYIFIELVCAWIYAFAGWLLSKNIGSFNKDKLMNQLSGLTMIGLGAWLAIERPPR